MAASLAVAASLAHAPAAHAQATDRVMAEALFREGRDLMEHEKTAEACLKFAESYRLDRALGTLLNLALCHEKDGKTATAWAEFSEAASDAAAEHDDREAFARKHLAALALELPRLKVAVDPAASAVPSLEVKIDGHATTKAAWSSLLPIDPGEHTIEAAADGKKSWSATFAVARGAGLTEQTVPALEDAPRPITVAPPAPTSDPTRGRTQRNVGYAVAGTGGVGLVLGAAFGLSALSLKGDRDERCSPADGLCDAEGVAKDRDARTAATVSTIAIAAGGALLAGGIVLVLLAPKSAASTQVGLGGRGLFLRGTF